MLKRAVAVALVHRFNSGFRRRTLIVAAVVHDTRATISFSYAGRGAERVRVGAVSISSMQILTSTRFYINFAIIIELFSNYFELILIVQI